MEKDILNKLKMDSREEAVSFLKSLWSEKPQPCPLCGGKLDINNKCKKCGKQYFKFNKNIILYLVIGLLVITNILLLLLYDDAKKEGQNIYEACSDNPTWCETQLDSLVGNKGTNYTKEKLDFFDENIVFVIEGYGDYYYSYDCVQRVTSGEYTYWAYNKEAAISKGYRKGTCN